MDLNTRIRLYHPKDREEVQTLCADTAFLGDPIDPIFQDRKVLADIIVTPYLDLEPEHAFVVENKGRVVGYMTGALDPNFEFKRTWNVLQTVVSESPRSLFYDKRSKEFVKWTLLHSWRQIPDHPDNAPHLHLNLAKGFRGKDYGLSLLNIFESMVRMHGFDQYYGEVFSWSKRPERLYELLDFEIFDKVESTMFYPEIQDPVHLLCVHKRLERA